MKLHYTTEQELPDYLQSNHGQILSVVAFGRSEAQADGFALLQVDIPILGEQNNSFEIWTSHKTISPFEDNGIVGSQDDEVLFGSLSIEQQPEQSLEALTARSYKQIFGCIDRRGYRNLLRVWHYFPQINDDENGLERYRCFNAGRHEAFVASGRSIDEETVPAASALGSNSGSLIIYFIAAKQPGKAVDNPRQTRAYHYPALFGPRSPIFSRALLVQIGAQQCFFVSGTASIVGHETLHHGNLEKQTRETLLNIRVLLEQISRYDADKLLLKVYLRHAADLPRVQALVDEEFGVGRKVVYLHSSICRADLLIEIEGVHFNEIQS